MMICILTCIYNLANMFGDHSSWLYGWCPTKFYWDGGGFSPWFTGYYYLVGENDTCFYFGMIEFLVIGLIVFGSIIGKIIRHRGRV